MSDRPPRLRSGAAIALALLLLAALPARAQQLVGAAWNGDDLVLRLSDSAAYAVDIDESDTARAVVRLWGVQPSGNAAGAIEIPGPNGRSASITRNPPNELLVTLSSASRFGCATLWRPYTRTLVVHTFRWEGLPYAQEQYYRALLAFEQSQPDLAVSLLRGAHAAGERRATSALATWYARHGENDLARLYLNAPATGDDYGALESVQRAAGDSAGAAASHASAVGLERTLPLSLAQTPSNSATLNSDSSTSLADQVGGWFTRERLPIVLIVAGGALLLIVLITIIVRRASKRARQERTVAPAAPVPSTPVHGVRVVAPEPAAPSPLPEPPVETVAPTAVVAPVADIAEPTTTLPVAVEQPRAESAAESNSPTAVEAPEVEEIETPVEEPVVERSASEEEMPHISEASAPVAEEPIVAEEPATESTATTEPERLSPAEAAASSRSRQADELRRRIEMARSAPVAAPTSAPDATIAEARRGDLSRDAVALRRKLQGEDGEERS